MSFLSFYNDHHGARADEELLNFIEEDRWNEADFFARTNPLEIKWTTNVPQFYEGVKKVKVLAIHVACKRQPPPSFLSTLYQINSKGFVKVDSVYKRTPLHVACMNVMEPTSLIKLIELCPKAAKVKDALGRLPMHYACKNPKMDSIVGDLLKAHPGAALVKDQQGFLPIHVACRVGQSVDTIRLLISTAPESKKKKTKKGSTPYMCAKNMKAAHREQVMELVSQ
ncbi:unnamed protein product [Cylindrotheca closterium]|uniref:Uncharacterized protein n=1 Tax=Cylindrotheca closterium TaxID=2856 RepID=A0AAD2JNI9_9STRA|nr:unnamed protein product [Cylindrotheca closterium]